MIPRYFAKFEDERRYATPGALAIEGMATVTEELVDLHYRIMIKLAARSMPLSSIVRLPHGQN